MKSCLEGNLLERRMNRLPIDSSKKAANTKSDMFQLIPLLNCIIIIGADNAKAVIAIRYAKALLL